MKTTSFFLLVYSVIALVSGSMAFVHDESYRALFIEVFISIVLFVDSILMMKKKRFTEYVALFFSAFLLIYYASLFSYYKDYMAGVLTGVSIFMVIILLIKIFKISNE